LDETDFNAFINNIDDRWEGSLPATLILDQRTGKRDFFEKQFAEGELEAIVKRFIN